MTKRETKSPINNLPVRMPGQSVREALGELVDEKAMPWLMGSAMAIVFAVVEWLRWVFDSTPQSWVYTIIFGQQRAL